MNETLNDLQKEALKKSNIKAKIHSKNLKHLIIHKFIDNNIDLKYIDLIIDYIKEKSYITTMIPIISTKSTPSKNINPRCNNLY
jgi:hypothetical protein